MFDKITKRDKRTKLEKEIDSVLDKMSTLTPDTTEYSAISANLERLYKAKAQERERHISPDMIASVAGNLLGLILIMNYEKTEIIRTKALGFIMKGRV